MAMPLPKGTSWKVWISAKRSISASSVRYRKLALERSLRPNNPSGLVWYTRLIPYWSLRPNNPPGLTVFFLRHCAGRQHHGRQPERKRDGFQFHFVFHFSFKVRFIRYSRFKIQMRGNSLKPHESQGLTACGKDDISDRGVALNCF